MCIISGQRKIKLELCFQFIRLFLCSPEGARQMELQQAKVPFSLISLNELNHKADLKHTIVLQERSDMLGSTGPKVLKSTSGSHTLGLDFGL